MYKVFYENLLNYKKTGCLTIDIQKTVTILNFSLNFEHINILQNVFNQFHFDSKPMSGSMSSATTDYSITVTYGSKSCQYCNTKRLFLQS